jgi:hypothetical protein
VHHRTIQINHKPDATIFQFIILKSVYSSTCFGRFPAHHRELNDCGGSLWFYLRIVVTVVLCSWSGRPANLNVLRLLCDGQLEETNTLAYQQLCGFEIVSCVLRIPTVTPVILIRDSSRRNVGLVSRLDKTIFFKIFSNSSVILPSDIINLPH